MKVFNCIKWKDGKYVLDNDPSLEVTPIVVRDEDELKILSVPSTRDFGDVKKIGEIEIKEDWKKGYVFVDIAGSNIQTRKGKSNHV